MRGALLAVLAALAPVARVHAAAAPGDWVAWVSSTPQGLRWMAMDPRQGKEETLAELPSVPTDIFWTNDWSKLYYRLGATLYSRPWSFAGKASAAAEIPEDVAKDLHAVWIDSTTGRLMVSTMTEDPKAPNPSGIGLPYWARVWELNPKSGRWSKVVERATDWGAGETLGPAVLRGDIHTDVRAFSAIVRDGTAAARWQELQETKPGALKAEATLHGLRLRISWGDTPHFMAPVVYDAGSRAEKVVYPKGRGLTAQVLVLERGDWTLLCTEYDCSCPVLVNTRTGAARDLGASNVAAAWVGPPSRK